jgi:prephenate dehydratase
MRLGYLGPAGTFTHAALLASDRAHDAEAIPFPTERETILAAVDGRVDAALVPIENALEGGVNATLDTLALDAPGARIVGEELLPISHALIARRPLALGAVTAVVSHPQPLGQCRRYLATQLAGRRTAAATSTAEAVRTVAESAEPWVAIGPEAAAGIYGAVVLERGIEDEPGNETRFVWVSAGPAPFHDGRAGAPARTSVVFHGPGDGTPGWLMRCLAEFASREINLTRIESRPRKQRLGHYLFLVDLDGHERDPRVHDAIAGLRGHCELVRVLGSYPVARPAAARR